MAKKKCRFHDTMIQPRITISDGLPPSMTLECLYCHEEVKNYAAVTKQDVGDDVWPEAFTTMFYLTEGEKPFTRARNV